MDVFQKSFLYLLQLICLLTGVTIQNSVLFYLYLIILYMEFILNITIPPWVFILTLLIVDEIFHIKLLQNMILYCIR